MTIDRRAPGIAILGPTTDGRWRIAYDECAAIVVDTRERALALLPSGSRLLFDPDSAPPDTPWETS